MFFPVRTESIMLRSPLAVIGIIAVTILLFVITRVTQSDGEFVSTVIEYGSGGTSVLGHVGHLVLHAGWVHLISNMWFLMVFGVAVCGRVGGAYFVACYLAIGIVGSLIEGLFVDGLSIGASGAVTGTIGAYVIIAPRTRVVFWFWWFFRVWDNIKIPSWVVASAWFLLDAFGVLGPGDGVNYVAHILGLAIGLVLGLLAVRFGVAPLVDEEPSLPELRGWTWALPRSERGRLRNRDAVWMAETRHEIAPKRAKKTHAVSPPRVARPPAHRTPDASRTQATGPALATVLLTCGCGWSVEGPALFMGDGARCRRCQRWISAAG
jgi:membrane associated rhomboid family serine protease